jgi:hypothetical protein
MMRGLRKSRGVVSFAKRSNLAGETSGRERLVVESFVTPRAQSISRELLLLITSRRQHLLNRALVGRVVVMRCSRILGAWA